MTRRFRPTTLEQCYVEIYRLETLLDDALKHKRVLEHDCAALREDLTTAQAGAELAELIKRIVSP